MLWLIIIIRIKWASLTERCHQFHGDFDQFSVTKQFLEKPSIFLQFIQACSCKCPNFIQALQFLRSSGNTQTHKPTAITLHLCTRVSMAIQQQVEELTKHFSSIKQSLESHKPPKQGDVDACVRVLSELGGSLNGVSEVHTSSASELLKVMQSKF